MPTDATVSFSTNVNAEGSFTVMGLAPGTYNLTITPASPLVPVVKTNIVVTAGITTDLGTIIL